jgi:phage terminase small subunit
MANEKDLTPKEIRFIEIYFENGFNATRAVREVHPGITDGSARSQGWEYLTRPKVKDEIDRRMHEWRAKRRLTVEQVGDLIQDFATVEVIELFTENGDLRPLSEMTPRARRCIQSIETEERMIAGEPVEVKKIKLVDRKGAAELLGKYKKMFTDNVDVTSGGKPLKVAISITGKGRA